jgi:hypothetical protein
MIILTVFGTLTCKIGGSKKRESTSGVEEQRAAGASQGRRKTSEDLDIIAQNRKQSKHAKGKPKQGIF